MQPKSPAVAARGNSMNDLYEDDVLLWSEQQAALLGLVNFAAGWTVVGWIAALV